MSNLIYFNSVQIDSYLSLFYKFYNYYFYSVIKNDQTKKKSQITLSFDHYETINQVFNQIAEPDEKLSKIENELLKIEGIFNSINDVNDSGLTDYKTFLEKEKKRLQFEEKKIRLQPISILYLPEINSVSVFTNRNILIQNQIEKKIKDYLINIHSEKIHHYKEDVDFFSMQELDRFGIKFNDIISEINLIFDLEDEKTILSNTWYIEYSVVFHIKNIDALNNLLNESEFDFSDFDVIGDTVIWSCNGDNIIDNDNEITGLIYHPLDINVEKKLARKILQDFENDYMDQYCIDLKEISTLLELSDDSYSIKIDYYELDNSDSLTELSLKHLDLLNS
jgi:hypothetical protein